MDLKGKNVYISGPITGKLLNNAPAFAEAHAMLREMGAAAVYNPTLRWLRESVERSHERYMLQCVSALSSEYRGKPFYDAIVLLDGFESSEGALVELSVAKALGIPSVKMGDLRNLWSDRNAEATNR